MTDAKPVWVLLGQRTGDNNQLLRLAGELGVPFRAVELRYNKLHRVSPRLLKDSFASLDGQSRRQLEPPWPKLVLGIGYRSVPPALEIRERSGVTTKLVRLGNPRLHPRNFNLVITTPQYNVPDAPNVLRLPVGISTAPQLEPTREEAEWLAKLPRPHRLLLIGGKTFMWSLDRGILAQAATALKRKPGGSVIAISSPRSDEAMIASVAEALQGSEHAIVHGPFPRYPVLLDNADEIYVTGDSVAMISDAVATGKPLGLILPEKTRSGKFFYSLDKAGFGVPVRDIRRFWTSVQQRGLAGSLDNPASGKLAANPLGTAVAAVRDLL